MKVIILVAVLCAVAFAQVPTVQQSLASFDQNGGVLTVYGTGFIQRNLDQFTYNLVTGNNLCPATNPCRFVCHYRTMVVNPAGTITYCEVPYFPDNTLGPAGSNYITLSINNANGATVTPVTVATIRAVVSDIIPSTSNPIPPAPFGITINGVGFPSENSLFTQSGVASAYTLTLTDNTNPYPNIDLLATRSVAGLTPSPLSFWDYTNTVPKNMICRFTKVQIDCYYMAPAAAAFVVNNNINGVFASLVVTQAFVTANPYNAVTPEYTDRIGPVQIGIVQVPVAPSVTAIPTASPYTPASFLSRSDQFLTLSGANFLQYPVMNGNVFVPKLDGTNSNYLRCDPVSVTTSTFTCALSARPIVPFGVDIASGTKALNANIGVNVAGAVISGTIYVAKTLLSTKDQAVAITNSGGNTAATFKYPLNAATSLPDPSQSPIPQSIVPNDQPIQQDALTVTFQSTGSSFLAPDINYLYEYALKSAAPPVAGSASAPANISPVVTITNLNGVGGSFNCYSIFPDQVDPNTTPLQAVVTKAGVIATANPQSTPATDVCTIVSVTPSSMTIKLPQTITSPVGTVVSAALAVTTSKISNVGVATANIADTGVAATTIGIVAPGAGVGGDPHFFGFLGEKYEFAGEAGRVYNLLSDEGIQLNAEIGYWHWNRGKETIIRKLALKTNDHRVLIDAGGNNLGTEGFSISVDGASIAPSRIRQTYLGSEGWIRWYPLTADDKFRLPLWERHQGVALIDIFLNDYKFQVLAVEEGKDKDGVWHKQPSRFLDFMAEMLTDRRPHGLFGQSAHLRANQRSVKEFTIEGEGNDYEVSNLFGDDFTFNKFSAK